MKYYYNDLEVAVLLHSANNETEKQQIIKDLLDPDAVISPDMKKILEKKVK